MKKTIRTLGFTALSALALLPVNANAQAVSFGNAKGIIEGIQNGLLEIIPPLAILSVVLIGVYVLFNLNNPGALNDAKKMFLGLVVALLIIYGASAIVNSLRGSL